MNGEATRTNLETARGWKTVGRLSDAADLLQKTLAECEGSRLSIHRELADVHAKRGAWADADKSINEGMNCPDCAKDARASLLERRAWILFRQEKLDEAERTARDVLRDLDEQNQPAVAASLRNTLAGIAWRRGQWGDAIQEIELAAAFFERANDRCGTANAKTNLGILHLTQGEWSEAAAAFSESEDIRRSIDAVNGRSANLLSLGWLEAIRGNREQARVRLQESLRIATDAGEQYDISHAELALAYLDVLNSRFDDARRHLDAVLKRQDFLCDGDRVQSEWLQAVIECDKGALERAVNLALKARDTARDRNLLDSQIDASRALGVAYDRSGKMQDAEKAFSESAELAERARDPYRRGLALLEMGRMYERSARRDAARERAEEAAQLFERLGARCEYDRAQAVRLRLS